MKNVAKILLYDQDHHVLVLYRSSTHPYFPHEIDLPGGEIDGDETPAEAIVREVFEETGLTIGLHEVTLVNSRVTHFGREDNIFIATINVTKPAVTISWEHESFDWIDVDQLPRLFHIKDVYMMVVQSYLEKGASILVE